MSSIIIPRASTFFGRIRLNDGQENGVLLTETDKMIFEVRNSPERESGVLFIRKIMTHDDEFEGGYGFELTPEETDIPVGTYYYGVGVQRENGEFYHVIPTDKFIIKKSIPRKVDNE